MTKSGERINAGQEIRLADIEADAGCGMGIFEAIHDQLSPASMALSILSANYRENINRYGVFDLSRSRQSMPLEYSIYRD